MPGIGKAIGDALSGVDNSLDNSARKALDNATTSVKKATADMMGTLGKELNSNIPTPKVEVTGALDNAAAKVDNVVEAPSGSAIDNAVSEQIVPKMDTSWFKNNWKTPDDISINALDNIGGSLNEKLNIMSQAWDDVVVPMVKAIDPDDVVQTRLKDIAYGMADNLDGLTKEQKNLADNMMRILEEDVVYYESKTGMPVNRQKDYYPRTTSKMIDSFNNDNLKIKGGWDAEMEGLSYSDSFYYKNRNLINYDDAQANLDVIKRHYMTSAASTSGKDNIKYQIQDVLDDTGEAVDDAEIDAFAEVIETYSKDIDAFNNGVDEEVEALDNSIKETDTAESAQKKTDKTVDKIEKNVDKIELPTSKKKNFNFSSRKQRVSIGGFISRNTSTGIERAKKLTFTGWGENAGKKLNMYDDGGFKQYRWAFVYGKGLFNDMVNEGIIDNTTLAIDAEAATKKIAEMTSQKYMPTLVQSLRTGKSSSGVNVTTVQDGLTKKLVDIANDNTLDAIEKQSQMIDAITNMYKMTARSQVKWNIMMRLEPEDEATEMFLQRYFNRMQVQDAVNKSVMARLTNSFVNMRSAGLLGLNFRATVQNISETGRILFWYSPGTNIKSLFQSPREMLDTLKRYGVYDGFVSPSMTEEDIIGKLESIISTTSDLARVPFTYTEMYKNAVFLKAAELKYGKTLSGRELYDAVISDYERLSISSGFMSSIGAADTEFGRLATMFYQYPIKEIKYTLSSIDNIWKGTDNKALALGKEAAFILSWLSPKAAYYLAMNWAGVTMTQAFSIFDPFGQIEESYDGISDEDRIWLDDVVSMLPLSAALSPLRTMYFQSRKNGIAAAEEETGTEDPITGEKVATGFVMGNPFGKDVTNEAIRSLPGGAQIKRTMDAIKVLDAGGSFSAYTGDLQYEAPDDWLEIINMFINGKSATRKAQNYFGNANPYKGIAESAEKGDLSPLGAELSKDSLVEAITGNKENSMSSFAPYDNEYSGQFDGSYNDKYTFRDAISQIKKRKKEIVEGDGGSYSLRSLYKQLLYEQNKREKDGSVEPTEKEKSLLERIDNLESEIVTDLQNLSDAYMAAGHEITESEQNSMLQILDFEQTDSDTWDYLTERRNKYVEAGLPEDVTAKPGESLSMQYIRDKYYGASADMEDDIKKIFTGKTVDGKILPNIKTIKQNYSDQFFALQKQGKYDEAGAVLEEYIQQYFMPRVDVLVDKYGAYEVTSSSNAIEELANYLFAVPSDYTKDNNGRYFSSKKYSGKTSALKAFAETYIKDLYGNGAVNTWAAETSDAKARDLINEINDSLDDGEVASAKVKARRLINDMNNGKVKLSNTDARFLNLVLNMD